MKKHLRLIFLISVILIIALLLASCKDRQSDSHEEVSSEVPSQEVSESIILDISKYTLVRPERTTNALITSCTRLFNEIESRSGKKVKEFKDDWLNSRIDEKPQEFEILVGYTNRPESKQVFESLEDTTFALKFINNKLVIIGTSDNITVKAIDYFLSECLSDISDGNIKFPVSESDGTVYISSAIPQLNIAKDGKSEFTVIFKDGIDTKYSNDPEAKDNQDCEAYWSRLILDEIKSLSGIKDIGYKTDWIPRTETEDFNSFEILVGETNRTATAQVLSELAYNEYAVKCIGNKIVVTGHNLKTTRKAVDEFLNLLRTSVNNSSDQGYKEISFLSGTEIVGSTDEYYIDIPEYDNAEIKGTYDCNDGNLMFFIPDTNKKDFDAYCQKIVGTGFKLYDENVIGKNTYRTYTKKNVMIHTYCYEDTGEVRIITAKDIYLDYKDEKPYTKVTDSSISQLTLDYSSGNFGMSYVITLEDSSFIIYDGGGSSGKIDHKRLHDLLKQQNKSPDGKIHIAAWVITHDHWDHTSVLKQYINDFGSDSVIEKFITNVPESNAVYNSYNPGSHYTKGLVNLIKAMGGELIKCHSGMKFNIRNAELEVLYTHEDYYPSTIYTFNNSSTMTRVRINGQTITFLGDMQSAACNIVTEHFGKADLKSDIVQVSHHGYDGATQKIYNYLSPTILLWPTDRNSFNNQTSGKGQQFYQTVDYYIARNLGVKEIFVAGDGSVTLPLPYAPKS